MTSPRTVLIGRSLAYLVALVAIFAVIVGLQILVMIYGWGLTPHSWWWIVLSPLSWILLKPLGDVITAAMGVDRQTPQNPQNPPGRRIS